MTADPHAHRHGDLSRAVRATGAVTLLSRVGGLVRDVIVGRVFGDTAVGSAFAAAFAIPNMFRRLFGEGALSAAFIPAYTDARHAGGGGQPDADRLAAFTLIALGAITGALTAAIELALLAALVLLPADAERDLSIKLIMVMLPFMPLICAVAILAGMLQVHARFGPAASGPLILNAFIIAVGAYCLLTGQLAGERVAYALGVATVLSGVTQFAWFLRLLRPHVHWTRAWREARPRALTMLKKFVPVAVGLGTLQLNTFLDTLIAMWPIWVGPTMLGRAYTLDEKSNIILALTQRLYQFPLGVFGIAVATAAFPLLARHAREDGPFIDTLRRGLRLSLFIGLPASLGLILIRHDLTAVMFGHGKTGWSPESLSRSASVLLGFATGIWAYSLNQVLTRAFYARADTATPMRVSLAMIAVNIALNLTLIWPLREAGLAWSTAIAAMLQTLILSALCARMLGSPPLRGGFGSSPAGGGGPRSGPEGDLRPSHAHETHDAQHAESESPSPPRSGGVPNLFDPASRRSAARIALATLAMGLLVWAVMRAVPLNPPMAQGILRGAWTWQLARVGIACALGGVSYLILARALRLAELSWLVRRGGADSPAP